MVEFRALTTALQASPHVLPGSVDSWLDGFVEHSARISGSGGSASWTNASVFYSGLQQYLASPDGARHAVNVQWSTDGATVVASRVPALFRELPDAPTQIAAMHATRAIAAEFGAAFPDSLVYTYPMVFWEGLMLCSPS